MRKLELMAHKIDVNARAFAGAANDVMNKRRESGQGTIEYVGIIVIIAIVVVALAAWFTSTGNKTISDGIGKIIGTIFGKAPA